MRVENIKMKNFLQEHDIKATPKYIRTGSLKGCWRLCDLKQKWTENLMVKLIELGFTNIDGDSLNNFSGNGGFFSISVKSAIDCSGHSQLV